MDLSPSLCIYIYLTCAIQSLAARRAFLRNGRPSLYIECFYLSMHL